MGTSRELTEAEVDEAVRRTEMADDVVLPPVGIAPTIPIPAPPRPVVPPPPPTPRPSGALGITASFTKEMRGRLQELRRLVETPFGRTLKAEEQAELLKLTEAERPYLEARAKAAK